MKLIFNRRHFIPAVLVLLVVSANTASGGTKQGATGQRDNAVIQ